MLFWVPLWCRSNQKSEPPSLQRYIIISSLACTRERYVNDALQVVIRRLPPNLSKEQLEEQLSPLPSYDYFEFFPADQRCADLFLFKSLLLFPHYESLDIFSIFVFLFLHSLYPHLFSRAYINFKNPEDILLFRDRFDGYVFIDNKGNS